MNRETVGVFEDIDQNEISNIVKNMNEWLVDSGHTNYSFRVITSDDGAIRMERTNK